MANVKRHVAFTLQGPFRSGGKIETFNVKIMLLSLSAGVWDNCFLNLDESGCTKGCIYLDIYVNI